MCLPSKATGTTIQRIATTVASLVCFNFGLMFGITPIHVVLYQNAAATPLKHVIDARAANWVSGYLFGGVAIGAICLGSLTHKIGPKSILYLGGLLQVTSWFTIHFAFDILHIYASRLFAGVAAGAALVALPIFINEITSDAKIAAKYTASIEFWRALGVLLGFIFAQFLLYDLVAIVGIALSLVLTLTLPFVQESPFYYMSKRNVMALEKSLRWYRGIREMDDRQKPEFLREVADFKREMREAQPIVTSTVPFGYKVKLGFFCAVLLMGAQLAGVYFVLNFVLQLYSETHIAFIFAAVQLVGALLGTWIGIKIRRKLLLALTGLLSGCILIALVFIGKVTFDSMETALTVTIGLIALHILLASIGVQPFSIVVAYELLPAKLRATYLSIIYALPWLILLGLSQSFQYLAGAVSLPTYFSLFAGACFVVALMSMFVLPDTESKTAEEVHHEMGFVSTESVAKITTATNGQIHEHNYM